MSEQTKRWWQAAGDPGPENHGPDGGGHHWGGSGTQ